MNIYIAAPLFNKIEIERNQHMCDYLESNGFNVYLPQRDGRLLVNLISNGMEPNEAKKLVFKNDTNAILDSDLILVIMDGRTIDEGASFELGFAYANKKRCIGLQTDIRRLFPYGNNPMIEIALEHIFKSEEELLLSLTNKYKKSLVESCSFH